MRSDDFFDFDGPAQEALRVFLRLRRHALSSSVSPRGSNA